MGDLPETVGYPLLFEPVLKSYIWGGRNLERILGRGLPEGMIAESWEIAAHRDGDTCVLNGPLAGKTLKEVHHLYGLDLIGSRNNWAQERNIFPLLIKLLDAHDKLSVQVHPDDQYALTHEGNELGKTEMWVVLHAEPEAAIILGIRAGTTQDSFQQALHDGTLESHLHKIPIRTGDFICVPSRTLHAILGGALIAEIQQNSNTTYRVYDWNRIQADGRPRELHIDRAMDVIDFGVIEPSIHPPTQVRNGLVHSDNIRRWLLCQNRYFVIEKIEFIQPDRYNGVCDGQSLEIWGVIEGQVQINGVDLDSVQFALLPAVLGEYEVRAPAPAVCLRVYTGQIPEQSMTDASGKTGQN